MNSRKYVGVIELLKENPDKINWCWLSSNPSIFKKVYNNDDKIIIQKTLEIIKK